MTPWRHFFPRRWRVLIRSSPQIWLPDSDVLGGVLLASAWTTALLAWPPGIAVARGPCGRGAAVRRAESAPVIAVAAVVAALAVLIWRPLLLATIVLVTLTTVGLALAFERSLTRGRLPLRR